jgi:hypothetical protein
VVQWGISVEAQNLLRCAAAALWNRTRGRIRRAARHDDEEFGVYRAATEGCCGVFYVPSATTVAQPRSVGAHNTRRSKVQRRGTRVYRATAVNVRHSVFYQRRPCLPWPRGARATREEARHDSGEPGFTERPWWVVLCSVFYQRRP